MADTNKIEVVQDDKIFLLDGVAVSKEELGKKIQETAPTSRVREVSPGVFKTLNRMQG